MLVLCQLVLRAGLGTEVGKWVKNVAFATHAKLGGVRQQRVQGPLSEGGGSGTEKLKNKSQKEAKHEQGGFEGKGKGRPTNEVKPPDCHSYLESHGQLDYQPLATYLGDEQDVAHPRPGSFQVIRPPTVTDLIFVIQLLFRIA